VDVSDLEIVHRTLRGIAEEAEKKRPQLPNIFFWNYLKHSRRAPVEVIDLETVHRNSSGVSLRRSKRKDYNF
jgi:hypothetical protein